MASNRFFYYILAAFITGNLLLILIQYNSVKNINSLIEGNEKVLNEFTVEAELRDLRKNTLSVEAGIGNAIDSGDTTHITDLQPEIAAAENNLGKLQKIDDNDSTAKYIDQLDSLVHEKIHFNNQVLHTFYAKGKDSAGILLKNGKEKDLTGSITLVTHKLDSTRRHLLTGITDSIDQSGQNARRWGIILFIMVGCSGAALFWFIINRVRKQNQLILQLDASEKRVTEAARAKENFIANMSHEIRTPLNAIIGFTGLLQKKNLDAEAAMYTASIQQSGNSLLRIVNDILDLSKFEAGMMRAESFPFSLHGILDAVETMFHEKALEKKLELVFAVNESIPDTLEGDGTRLTQILVNLIGNAVKFTDNGSVRLYADNRGITGNTIKLFFSITDTGIGIEENKLPRIFERFRQAEASITRKYGGTGLGLSIVKDLVELQNGEITAESRPGTGSTFKFMIPYKIASSKPLVVLAGEPAGTAAATVLHGRILVVEDNEMNQKLMTHLLTQWQLSFTIVNSGKQAIERLKEASYDLILMDIQMPEMDGYTAAQTIRQQLRLDTPIVVMTAHVLAGEKEKCIGYGMNDYISKPIKEKELLDIILRFIPAGQKVIPVEKEIFHPAGAGIYTCINLQYMQEISNGNKEYEKTVTEEFIETIPAAITAMETTLHTKDFATLQQLAHNMKTTVSVMGLTDHLRPYLDALEYENPGKDAATRAIETIKETCTRALAEARLFYSTL